MRGTATKNFGSAALGSVGNGRSRQIRWLPHLLGPLGCHRTRQAGRDGSLNPGLFVAGAVVAREGHPIDTLQDRSPETGECQWWQTVMFAHRTDRCIEGVL